MLIIFSTGTTYFCLEVHSQYVAHSWYYPVQVQTSALLKISGIITTECSFSVPPRNQQSVIIFHMPSDFHMEKINHLLSH